MFLNIKWGPPRLLFEVALAKIAANLTFNYNKLRKLTLV